MCDARCWPYIGGALSIGGCSNSWALFKVLVLWLRDPRISLVWFAKSALYLSEVTNIPISSVAFIIFSAYCQIVCNCSFGWTNSVFNCPLRRPHCFVIVFHFLLYYYLCYITTKPAFQIASHQVLFALKVKPLCCAHVLIVSRYFWSATKKCVCLYCSWAAFIFFFYIL